MLTTNKQVGLVAEIYDAHLLAENKKKQFRIPLRYQPKNMDSEAVLDQEAGTFFFLEQMQLRLVDNFFNKQVPVYRLPFRVGDELFIQENVAIKKSKPFESLDFGTLEFGPTFNLKTDSYLQAHQTSALHARSAFVVEKIQISRLQEINEGEAMKEGYNPYLIGANDEIALIQDYSEKTPYRNGFIHAWDSKFIGHDELQWETNPFVLVLNIKPVLWN